MIFIIFSNNKNDIITNNGKDSDNAGDNDNDTPKICVSIVVTTVLIRWRIALKSCRLWGWATVKKQAPSQIAARCYFNHPYPEPVYTGWSSVHWNATGMPLFDPVYTGIPLEKTYLKQPHTGMPLEKLSWIRPTLGCHWRNSNFCSLH